MYSSKLRYDVYLKHCDIIEQLYLSYLNHQLVIFGDFNFSGYSLIVIQLSVALTNFSKLLFSIMIKEKQIILTLKLPGFC